MERKRRSALASWSVIQQVSVQIVVGAVEDRRFATEATAVDREPIVEDGEGGSAELASGARRS